MPYCSLFSSAAYDSDEEEKDDSNTATQNDTPTLLRVAVGSTNPSKLQAVSLALQELLTRSSRSKLDNIDIQAFTVPSGVSDQPFGDAETMLGAKNRAKAAYRAYQKANDHVSPHLAFGMEGGLEWIEMMTHHPNNNNNTASYDHPTVDEPEQDMDHSQGSSHSSHNNNTNTTTTPPALFCMAWMAVYGKRTGAVLDLLCSDTVTDYKGDRAPVFGLARSAAFCMPPEIVQLITKQGMELGDADNVVFQRTNSKHGEGTVGILTKGIIDRPHYYQHAIVLALSLWIRPDVYPTGFC